MQITLSILARARECTVVKSSRKGRLRDIERAKNSETGRCLQSPHLSSHPEIAPTVCAMSRTGSKVRGARANNLKDVDVRFPVGRLSVITGISGSGKSTLMHEVLLPAVREQLDRKNRGGDGELFKLVSGVAEIEAVYEVDQSPIGKTSRSTPGTYVKVFDEIRNLYAQLPVSRVRGYSASRFSFNAEGGRCETCKGQGVIKLEMNFLPSSYVPCEDCGGRRYNPQTLEVLYNEKSIGDVMEMTIEEAAQFFCGSSKNRARSFAARRYRSWLSQTGTAESDLERRRSATTQARDAVETRGRPRAERTVAQNAQTEVDALSSRGTDHRSAHGRRGTVAQRAASARR